MVKEPKLVNLVRAGGAAAVSTLVMPNDDVQSLISAAVQHFSLPSNGEYVLLYQGKPLMGNVYEAVNPGDEIVLAQTQHGGA